MSEEKNTNVATVAPPDRGALYKALAAAQSEFRPVRKTKKAAYGKYADLAEIISAVLPALNAHGLFLSQDVRSVQGGVVVKTIIAHESGQTLESGELFMPASSSGKITAAQAFGSARTYACRYSLSSFLGIAADDDDDGQTTGKPGENIPSDPILFHNLLKGIEVADHPAALNAVAIRISRASLTEDEKSTLRRAYAQRKAQIEEPTNV